MHGITTTEAITYLACWLVAFIATLARIAKDSRLRTMDASVVVGSCAYSGILAVGLVTLGPAYAGINVDSAGMVGASGIVGLMRVDVQELIVNRIGFGMFGRIKKGWMAGGKAMFGKDEDEKSEK